jgi:hypothetical protein
VKAMRLKRDWIARVTRSRQKERALSWAENEEVGYPVTETTLALCRGQRDEGNDAGDYREPEEISEPCSAIAHEGTGGL